MTGCQNFRVPSDSPSTSVATMGSNGPVVGSIVDPVAHHSYNLHSGKDLDAEVKRSATE